jgi:hypothetical protein
MEASGDQLQSLSGPEHLELECVYPDSFIVPDKGSQLMPVE